MTNDPAWDIVMSEKLGKSIGNALAPEIRFASSEIAVMKEAMCTILMDMQKANGKAMAMTIATAIIASIATSFIAAATVVQVLIALGIIGNK